MSKPKSRAQIAASRVEKLVERLGVQQPEASLWKAVFVRAAKDLAIPGYRAAALEYFYSEDFESQARLVMVDPGAVRDHLVRGGLLPS